MDTHHKTSVDRDIVSNITIPKKKHGFFGFRKKKKKNKDESLSDYIFG